MNNPEPNWSYGWSWRFRVWCWKFWHDGYHWVVQLGFLQIGYRR